MTIEMGTRLGRYEIRSQIGAGGMGEVYLAYDSQLHRLVALKILPKDLAEDQQRMHRFVQEARSASALNHPNILTIYEIGQTDDLHFIATEYIEGENLREHFKHTHFRLGDLLDIATQIASAVAKAHQSGIIHRDIKPENIMVTRDGYVKVLDFGLSKLTEQTAPTDPEGPTQAFINTEPGKIMGTTRYMSPEQARGLVIDPRTDIWSLGVVLYEALASHPPFEGSTTTDLIVSIVEREPPPISRFNSAVPHQFERIVRKALAKDREERYQVIKDLQIDLKNLKRELELEAEIDRTVPREVRAALSTKGTTQSEIETTHSQGVTTAPTRSEPSMSSAEYVVTGIKRHKVAAVAAIALIFLAIGGVLLLKWRRAPALTDKDTILITDFVNTTGDAVFDGTLRQALAVQLAQSPFLNIFPDQGIHETLRYMGRSADERITRDIGREICERQGIKAMLVGSISNLGSHYVLNLEALNARTGEAIAREQAEALNKEQVLKSLGQIASTLREKLGESLASVQKFDAPVEQVTTSSLEALKAYSLGLEKALGGKNFEAIPLYRRATELDPNFAIAFARLATVYSNTRQFEPASQASQRAFELRERASEREKFYISDNYYAVVTQEVEKDLETLELWKQTYPRDYVPHNNLALRCLWAGQFERAIANASESVRLNPNSAPGYSNLARGFIGLNRFDEANEVVQRAQKQKLDATTYHLMFYEVAFVKGDSATMKQQTDWAQGKPDEYFLWDLQTKGAEFNGESRKADEFSGGSIELARVRESKEIAARFRAERAATLAVFGDCGHAKEAVAKALAISRARSVMLAGGTALALCGETESLQGLVDELTKRWPNDTLLINNWLPLMRALIEVHRGNPAQAIQQLEAARRYKGAAAFWPEYVRGEAYLAQSKGKEAAAEFQTILDHRGWAPLSALFPLAHLGLARSAVLQGDTANARKSYQDFFALWKDADPDIPILIKAKKEYEQVK